MKRCARILLDERKGLGDDGAVATGEALEVCDVGGHVQHSPQVLDARLKLRRKLRDGGGDRCICAGRCKGAGRQRRDSGSERGQGSEREGGGSIRSAGLHGEEE